MVENNKAQKVSEEKTTADIQDTEVSYSVVRSTVPHVSMFTTLEKILNKLKGKTIVFKRTKIREHGEIGYDYAGLTVSPLETGQLWSNRLSFYQSFLTLIMHTYFTGLITHAMTNGERPFLWLNEEYITDDLFFNSFYNVAFCVLVISVLMHCSYAFKVLKDNGQLPTQEKWAQETFKRLDKRGDEEVFKNLLIQWDYTDENFVNETVAQNFEEYINSLSEKSLTALVKAGSALNNFDLTEGKIDEELRTELAKEAKVQGDFIKQQILKKFNSQFENENTESAKESE